MSKYGHRPHNWFEAIVNKLGGEENANRFLRDELSVSEPTRSWREEDGVIYFSVTSDGTTDKEWARFIQSKAGSGILNCCRHGVTDPSFTPTDGVTYKIAILRGALFKNNERTTSKVRSEAKRRNLKYANIEAACLALKYLTEKTLREMGLFWVLTMHRSIMGADSRLYIDQGNEALWLGTYHDPSNYRFDRDVGFAFVVSSSQG